MATDREKEVRADARNFCESLGNVFMMKRRDPQTQHLLEKAKSLIETLLNSAERRLKSDRPSVPPKPSRAGGTGGVGGGGGGGGMGQLWVKLDELKRENEQLRRRQGGKGASDGEKSVTGGKSHGPGEVIIADLHKTKAENEILRAQLEKAQTTVAEMEKINHALQDEFKRSKIAHEVTQSSLEKVKREHQTLESSLNTVKSENDSLKMRLTQSVKPMKRPDARFVENIGERCRPSTVAVLYSNLEAQNWVDAKEAMEEAGFESEQMITWFLCDLLKTCYDVSADLLDDVALSVSEILEQPSKAFTNNQSSENQANLVTDELKQSFKDIMRQHVDKIDVEPLTERCFNKIRLTGNLSEREHALSLQPVRHYVDQCARVTWQMHVQQSPMWLGLEGGEFDPEIHRLWWSCSQANASRIQYYIWPSLYDVKGGNLMVKGCVYAS